MESKTNGDKYADEEKKNSSNKPREKESAEEDSH